MSTTTIENKTIEGKTIDGKVEAPAPVKPPAPPKRRPEDREFLPAALEILDTPPSPARMYLLLLICAFVVVSITWSFFGRIDIIAVAQGKIQPSGRVKIVQPVETGKVRAVSVKNGQHVSEGEILVEFDDADARSEEKSYATSLLALRAEMARRTASLAQARTRSFEEPQIEWPVDIPETFRLREERVLTSDLSQLSSAIESLAAQRRQKMAESDRLSATIASENELLIIQKERVDMRSFLAQSKVGSKASLIDAMETIQLQRVQLATQVGQLAEAKAAIETFERDMTKLVRTFTAENSQKLADASKQADEMSQRLVKAQVRIANLTLRAPAGGIVQNLAITNVGQVSTPGEELMRVVPDEFGYEIECYLPNKDIGFVDVGQEAIVKIESFPFTRYGSLTALVTRIAREAIPEPEAQQLESSPGKQANRNSFLGGAQRVQNLVFPLTLKPEQTSIVVEGTPIPISNGMAVSVEIRTGSRRIIDYVFSPLVEVASRALKER